MSLSAESSCASSAPVNRLSSPSVNSPPSPSSSTSTSQSPTRPPSPSSFDAVVPTIPAYRRLDCPRFHRHCPNTESVKGVNMSYLRVYCAPCQRKFTLLGVNAISRKIIYFSMAVSGLAASKGKEVDNTLMP